MTWAGELYFGACWAAFRGEAADNMPHAHAAVQLVFGERGPVTIVAADGVEHVGDAFVIQPLVDHSLIADDVVTLLWVEPQSPLAFHVADAIGDAEIAAFDRHLLHYRSGDDLAAWVAELTMRYRSGERPVDARLLDALATLADEPGHIGIADAARQCGLSDSRLRALARAQLGVPLSTWLIWRKLERAARALQDGEPLASAAAMGGFADQAHLSRAMRRMFGITPRAAQGAAFR